MQISSPPSLFKTEIKSCTNFSGWVHGSCDCGKEYLKKISCNKEWCSVCGQDGSHSHRRKIERWKNKIDEFENIGYLIITTPSEVWNYLIEESRRKTIFLLKENTAQKFLSKFGTYITRKLQRAPYNIKKGLRRWHFAGDCPYCKGKGCYHCNYKGTKDKFYPHLNLLVDNGYLLPELLKQLKIDCAKWIEKYTGLELKHDFVEIFYKYQTKDNIKKFENKKNHLLRYVTRATWKHEISSEYVKIIISGLKNAQTWGKYSKPAYKENKGFECSCGCRVKFSEYIHKSYDTDYVFIKEQRVGLFEVRKKDILADIISGFTYYSMGAELIEKLKNEVWN